MSPFVFSAMSPFVFCPPLFSASNVCGSPCRQRVSSGLCRAARRPIAWGRLRHHRCRRFLSTRRRQAITFCPSCAAGSACQGLPGLTGAGASEVRSWCVCRERHDARSAAIDLRARNSNVRAFLNNSLANARPSAHLDGSCRHSRVGFAIANISRTSITCTTAEVNRAPCRGHGRSRIRCRDAGRRKRVCLRKGRKARELPRRDGTAGNCRTLRKQTLNRRKRSRRRERAKAEMGLDRAEESGAIGLAGPRKALNHGRHGTTRIKCNTENLEPQALNLVEG